MRIHYKFQCISFVPLKSHLLWNITSEHILHLSLLGISLAEKVIVDIGMFHSPPFTNSHFQFIITVESSTSNCGFSVFQVLSLHNRPCAASTGAIFITDVHLTTFELRAPFSDMMHSHYATTIHFF